MKITRRQLRRIIKEALNKALPPHLQKHFRADGSSVRDPKWEDVTPAGYGPNERDYPNNSTMKRLAGQALRAKKDVGRNPVYDPSDTQLRKDYDEYVRDTLRDPRYKRG